MNKYRKTLLDNYKQRKVIGGIYKVTNTGSGKYFLDCATDLQAKLNAFNFMTASNTCFHFKLKDDWAVSGGRAFSIESLETLEKKTDQSQEEFAEDLKTLLQLWSEKLDKSKRY